MSIDAFEYFDADFLAIAHRGGAALPDNVGRENTMAAFRHAAALGITHMETDVHASADGVMFAFHDDDLQRLTGDHARIGELTSSQIDALDIDGEPIPRMRDLLEELPHLYFNIDIKSAAGVEPMAALVKDPDIARRVCVASFSNERLERFRALAGPTVATSMSPKEVIATAYAPRFDAIILRLTRAPGVVAQIPLVHQVGPLAIPLFSPRFVAMAHAAGKHVHVWTIDDTRQMRHLMNAGVDGIITDRPDRLVHVLPE